MIEQGAKNLIFANRSGLVRQDAKDAVQILQGKGASVAVYPCDVCESAQLNNLITQSSKSMPPIRGVIQSAMILRVSCSFHVRSKSLTYGLRICCWKK